MLEWLLEVSSLAKMRMLGGGVCGTLLGKGRECVFEVTRTIFLIFQDFFYFGVLYVGIFCFER